GEVKTRLTNRKPAGFGLNRCHAGPSPAEWSSTQGGGRMLRPAGGTSPAQDKREREAGHGKSQERKNFARQKKSPGHDEPGARRKGQCRVSAPTASVLPYWTTSPCSARSRPSRSTSSETRRPITASMILSRIRETTAS